MNSGRAALIAGALTVAVTLSVIGGLAVARHDGGGAPAAPPGSSPSVSPSPSPPTPTSTAQAAAACLSLVRGWRPTYLPAGLVAHGSEMARGSYDRQQEYEKKGTTQPTIATQLTFARFCNDPAVVPGLTNQDTTLPTNSPLTIRGHRIFVTDYGELIRIDWQEAPTLSLSLITGSSDGKANKAHMLSVAEMVRIGNGLVHDTVSADPSPTPDCPTLSSYRARTLPPGFRLAKATPGGEDDLDLSYVKGSGAAAVTIHVSLTCNVVLEHVPPRGMDPTTINDKQAYVTPPGKTPSRSRGRKGRPSSGSSSGRKRRTTASPPGTRC